MADSHVEAAPDIFNSSCSQEQRIPNRSSDFDPKKPDLSPVTDTSPVQTNSSTSTGDSAPGPRVQTNTVDPQIKSSLDGRDIDKLNKSELQTVLVSRGLSKTGNKSVLLDRLRESIQLEVSLN